MGHIIIRISTALLVAVACVLASAAGGRAEIFPVPADIRSMDLQREVVHTLETLKTGARWGEQRSRFLTEGDRLSFVVVTRFEDGNVSIERGVMDIADGYRARTFHKVDRRDGVVVGEIRVDFPSGRTEWTIDGVHQEQAFSFAPDTYAGPMLAFVLGSVPQKAEGHASFEMLTFRPDPRVYTIQVDVVDRSTCDLVREPAPATKLRLKADLGPIGNTLFDRLIPTHYFWYTQESSPDFFAFEGRLGHDGPELLMFPEGLQRSALARGRTIVAAQ